MAARKPKLGKSLTSRQRQQLKRLLVRTDFDEVRRLLMEAHLEDNDGNRKDAAKAIGVCEKTIYNWMRELAAEFPDEASLQGQDGVIGKLIRQSLES